MFGLVRLDWLRRYSDRRSQEEMNEGSIPKVPQRGGDEVQGEGSVQGPEEVDYVIVPYGDLIFIFEAPIGDSRNKEPVETRC